MRPPATSRERIDRIALELFLAEGYPQVTTERLIRACGVSRPTFFRYVPTRSAIVLDQIARFGTQVAEDLRRRNEPAAWAALGAALCAAVESLDPDSPPGMAFRILRACPEIRSSALDLTRRWRAELTDALLAGGHLAGDPERCEATAAMAIGLFQMCWAGTGHPGIRLRRAFEQAPALTRH